MWIAAKLFFSGALEKLLKALSAAVKWLFSDWRNGPLIVAAAMWAAHALLITPGLRDQLSDMTEARDGALAEREATMDAFEQTVTNYLIAAAQAQAEAEANVARVEAEQSQITQETRDAYQSRLAAVRARADELRRANFRAAPGDPGRAGAAGLPGPGDPARRVDAAPGDPRLPEPAIVARGACPSTFVCLTIDEAEIASAQAEQLDALITWSLRQSAVRFNPEARDDQR